VVESFASHGAYVRIGEVAGYLPSRLMASPAPRTPREHVNIGEQLSLSVSGFTPSRRSIEVSLLPVEKQPSAKPARTSAKSGDKSADKSAEAPAAPRSRAARDLKRRRNPG
jgi:ribosomal protein S1